jgi:hypothetical protein
MHADDGYVICRNGCRLGRGYQSLRACFCFTVIRSRRPERNDPQLNDQVTFVTRTKASGEFPVGDRIDTFELSVRRPARLRD